MFLIGGGSQNDTALILSDSLGPCCQRALGDSFSDFFGISGSDIPLQLAGFSQPRGVFPFGTGLRNLFAPYRGRNPQNREKRGFGVKNPPISHHPRKGHSESKNPHFYTEHYKEKGEFSTRSPLFWGGGKRGFFDSETLFSRFWGFRPL